MNFINPYVTFYTEVPSFQFYKTFPFYKEVIWTFLKHLDNQLGLFKHRINITFVDSDIQTGTRKFGSIYEYRIKVTEHLLLTRSEKEKRELLLSIIHEAFCVLADEHSWDRKVIDQAFQKAIIETSSFNFQSPWKLSKDRNHSGALAFELEESNLKINCIIKEKNSDHQLKVKLIETDEDNFSWSRKIKEFGWYDNNRFGLKFLNGDYWIVYHLFNDRIEEVIYPNKHSKKEIENCKRELGTEITTIA